jgi:hypothetical protein
VVSWIEIVFAGLVNDSHVAVLGCTGIGKMLVQLAEFKVLAPLVPHAKQKPLLRSLHCH